MLHLMLANGPEAFGCGEIYARFRPWRPYHTEIQCGCGQDPCPIWERLADAREEEFHARVLGLPGIDVAVDCSKRLDWVADANQWAERAGIRVANVLIWKEPMDLAYSVWKRNGALGDWPVTNHLYYPTRLLESGLSFVSICYTDLVTHPALELEALCQAIGVPYQPGREEFWRGEHHHLFGNGGVRAQLGRSDGAIRLDRDYPPEFLDAMAARPPTRRQEAEMESMMATLRRYATRSAS
jgi:hypothetical protein